MCRITGVSVFVLIKGLISLSMFNWVAFLQNGK